MLHHTQYIILISSWLSTILCPVWHKLWCCRYSLEWTASLYMTFPYQWQLLKVTLLHSIFTPSSAAICWRCQLHLWLLNKCLLSKVKSNLCRCILYVALCTWHWPVRQIHLPSVLWHCWLGIRKNIEPVKIDWWGSGMVISLERGANNLHVVQLMPLPPHQLLPH